MVLSRDDKAVKVAKMSLIYELKGAFQATHSAEMEAVKLDEWKQSQSRSVFYLTCCSKTDSLVDSFSCINNEEL